MSDQKNTVPPDQTDSAEERSGSAERRSGGISWYNDLMGTTNSVLQLVVLILILLFFLLWILVYLGFVQAPGFFG